MINQGCLMVLFVLYVLRQVVPLILECDCHSIPQFSLPLFPSVSLVSLFTVDSKSFVFFLFSAHKTQNTKILDGNVVATSVEVALKCPAVSR